MESTEAICLKVKDRMNFYRTHFHFYVPHHIILDASFVFATIACEVVNIAKHLSEHLGGKCKIFMTPCVLVELEQKAPQSLTIHVQAIVKNVGVYPCRHARRPAKSSECVKLIASQNQFKRYTGSPYCKRFRPLGLKETRVLVGTQDGQLLSKMRTIPGVPVLHFHNGALTMDKPSQLSLKWVEASRLKKIENLTIETEILKHALSSQDDLEDSGENEVKERESVPSCSSKTFQEPGDDNNATKKARALSPDICDIGECRVTVATQETEKAAKKLKLDQYRSLINVEGKGKSGNSPKKVKVDRVSK